MAIDFQHLIFNFLGGLGIFLLSIKYMGDGLKKTAGNKLKGILDKLTSNPLLGVLAGVIVTVLMQSSSGTTVLTVGLVNAGLMTLRQAIGVIMGANIGTTVTAFLLGLNIEEYALPIIGIGAVMMFFFSNEKLSALGQAIFGFGGLFFGLHLMSAAMAPLQNLNAFKQLMIDMSTQPFLGVFIGTMLTMLIQSSSATIGILQGVYAQGSIDLQAAIPVLIGDNIGTTITAILASIGASVTATRAALSHVIFNVIGAILFIISLPLFLQLIETMEILFALNPMVTIAVSHANFNIINTLIQLPFIGFLALTVTKLIPGKGTIVSYQLKYIKQSEIDHSPKQTYNQVEAEMAHIGHYVLEGLTASKRFLMTNEQKQRNLSDQYTIAIEHLHEKINHYLNTYVQRISLTETEYARHHAYLTIISNLKRIGKTIKQLNELNQNKQELQLNFTDEAKEDLYTMFEFVMKITKDSLNQMNRSETFNSFYQQRKTLKSLVEKLMDEHIQRANRGKCELYAGFIFVEKLENLQWIGETSITMMKKLHSLQSFKNFVHDPFVKI